MISLVTVKTVIRFIPWLSRETDIFWSTSALVLHADISQLSEVPGLFAVTECGVADKHAEARLESSDRGFLSGIE